MVVFLFIRTFPQLFHLSSSIQKMIKGVTSTEKNKSRDSILITTRKNNGVVIYHIYQRSFLLLNIISKD